MSTFYLGWDHAREPAARAAYASRFVSPEGLAFAAGPAAPPAAYSGTQDVLTWMDQGPVGSCFANAGAQSIEMGVCAGNRLGRFRSEMPRLSRHFVWYFCRKLDGSLGGWSDGGSITNTMRALDEYGCCPEAMAPYQPSHRALEQPPSDAAVAAALGIQFDGVAALDFANRDLVKRAIYDGHYPVIGIPWSYSWDTGVDATGRIASLGWPVGGHALVVSGWIEGWDGATWWEIINSHGPIYRPLPPDIARTVEGYNPARPDRSYSFWAREDCLASRLASWTSEIIAPINVAVAAAKAGGNPWSRV